MFHPSSIKQKLVSDMVSNDHGRGRIGCPRSTDGCSCFVAAHGEIGVLPNLPPDLTSFIMDFIQ